MNIVVRITGKDVSELGFETILYEKGNGRATITINRPKAYNAISFQSFSEINDALRDAQFDDGVAVVILTGSGDKAFCAGADLKEHYELCSRPRDYFKWINEFIAFQTRMVNLGKPTIARLNGLVVGAGNELNLACDLAVAADDVVIRQAGTARGSVAAIGVTQWLSLSIGDRRAREVLLMCEDIPAQKALDWGLINRSVPRAELDACVDELANNLIDKFAETTRHTLTQTNFFKNMVWGVTAPHAADWLAIHSGAPETYEGMEAFLEKRDVAHRDFRTRANDDKSPEFFAGPPIRNCPDCGAKHLPLDYGFCGVCGAELPSRKMASAAE